MLRRGLHILKKNWHWLFFVIIILTTVYMDVYISHNILDGDTSDFVCFGKTIAEQRNLFSTDRYYTTEARPFDVATVFSLFFQLTSDYTFVRIFGTVFMQVLYVSAFVYMCRQTGIGWRESIVGAGVLLMPFSVPYARLVLYHLHYILYLTNAFWIIGLTARMLQRKHANRLTGSILMGFWLLVGLNGIRHMMILGIPLLAFAAVELVQTLSYYRWENGKLTGNASFWKQDSVRLTAILAASSIFFLIGYVINIKWLLPYLHVGNMGSTSFSPEATAQRYADILNGWLVAIGVRCSELPLVSMRGASLLASLGSFGYLITSSLMACCQKKDERALSQRMVHSLVGVSFVTTTLIFIFESGGRHYYQYYAPVVALAAPSLVLELNRLKQPMVSVGRKLLIVLTCLCFVFQGIYTMYYLTVDRWDMDDWNGLPYEELNTVETVEPYVAFMRKEGYTHGMINYWQANVMMEVSDGDLVVAPLLVYRDEQGNPIIEVYHWGTSRSAFQKENLPERIVAFVDAASADGFEQSFPHLKKVYDGGSTFGYELSPEDIAN